MLDPTRTVTRSAWRVNKATGAQESGERTIPEETAIAFTYNGSSYAVMMATPQDLHDFAVGFTLTEGIAQSADEIESFEIIAQDIGVELRMRLIDARASALAERRRYLAGPTGCGLCGIESLEEAMRTSRNIHDDARFTPQDIMDALSAIESQQVLNKLSRAVHAAAFYRPGAGLIAVREDVGRHNALDKLAGAIARRGETGAKGFVVMTSRVSVELIQKSAMIGVPMLAAVSAPTALAVRTAEAAGMTLVAVARSDGFEIFTHPQRVRDNKGLHVVAG
ncbi:MAG: formate dehydrogenase accessory sulfurtransferase FdhD [Pseudolabrys sp.]|nr:formate dehydrogenase accessory sulfurtransferase FdhD [Pseudolabrys sp.]